MAASDREGNTLARSAPKTDAQRLEAASVRVVPGALLDVLGARHRVVAAPAGRVLLLDLRTHHVFLTQDEGDGSIQLPTRREVATMVASGRAKLVARSGSGASATDRMRAQVDLLDAAGVAQGDKAIWIHLTTHWTADLEARFGPHDQPWKIRRWRAALRRSETARDRSRRQDRADAIACGHVAPDR